MILASNTYDDHSWITKDDTRDMTCQCSGGMLLKSTSAERECKENTEYEIKERNRKLGLYWNLVGYMTKPKIW